MKKAHSKEWAFFQTLHSCLAKKAKKKSESVYRGHEGHICMIHKHLVGWQGDELKRQSHAHSTEIRANQGIEMNTQAFSAGAVIDA